jgi:hypothetical protein
MELDGRSSKKSLHNYSREDDEKLKSFSLFATQNKAQKMLENKLDKKKAKQRRSECSRVSTTLGE